MKLTTQELRQGNLIYGVSDRIETVTGIMDSEIIMTHIRSQNRPLKSYISDCNPIPLTEQWLLDLGFQLDFEDKNGLKSFINYKTDLDAINLHNGKFTFNFWENSRCPQYVHELQNILQSITGTELTLKTEA